MELFAPGEAELRKAMNEKDGTDRRIAGFDNVEGRARPAG